MREARDCHLSPLLPFANAVVCLYEINNKAFFFRSQVYTVDMVKRTSFIRRIILYFMFYKRYLNIFILPGCASNNKAIFASATALKNK